MNPFTPEAGAIPNIFAGRELVLRELTRILSGETSSPEAVITLSGAKGYGKTSLLSHLARESSSHGWRVIQNPNPESIRSMRLGTSGKTLVILDNARLVTEGLREFVDSIQNPLSHTSQTLLICTLQPGCLIDLTSKASDYLLRGAKGFELRVLSDLEASEALMSLCASAGKEIAQPALRIALEAAAGHPQALQLIGYRFWEASGSEPIITRRHVLDGAEMARRDLEQVLIDPLISSLSPKDIDFLVAMAQDEGPSQTSEVGRRLGKDATYARIYKMRLLRQGAIQESGRGYVALAIPQMRDYLRSLTRA